jgi:hypothetical protein
MVYRMGKKTFHGSASIFAGIVTGKNIVSDEFHCHHLDFMLTKDIDYMVLTLLYKVWVAFVHSHPQCLLDTVMMNKSSKIVTVINLVKIMFFFLSLILTTQKNLHVYNCPYIYILNRPPK